MATTIDTSFTVLSKNLEPTGLQKETVATRQQSVRDVLEKELAVLDTFLTGSYARHTMIAPLGNADIDIFVVLDSSYYARFNSTNGGQAGLLDLVKRTLRKTYTRTPEISRNGQAVTITFTDFQVDVVPGFYRNGGGYLIANSKTQQWVETDPKVHETLMSQQNSLHADDLVPLVKMIKGWNREIGGAFRSFYLELITVSILDGVTISSFPSGMRYFFDKGRDKVKYTATDPAGYGSQVQGLDRISTVADGVSRFQTAFARSQKAEGYAAGGSIRLAVEEWRKIFGDYFPAYG